MSNSKIIVPTDFSECANIATDYAFQFAIDHKLDIILLHTLELRYTDTGFFIDFDFSIKEISMKELNKTANNFLEKYPDLKGRVDVRCEVGGVNQNISTIEENESIKLIIMGTKGRTGWDEVLLGSEAASVIANSLTPVLVIPKTAEYKKDYEKVAYAIELENNISEQDEQLINLLIESKANISLFHSYEDSLELNEDKEVKIIQHFKNIFNTQNIKLDFGLDTSKVKSVEQYIEDSKPELVIAKTHQKGFLERIFTVSVTETLSYHSKIPLLILKK